MNLLEFDNEANPNAVIRDLNTIRVVLKWLPGYMERDTDDDASDNDSSHREHIAPAVHEKAAKHGHPGSAQLDKPFPSPRESRNSSTSSDNKSKPKSFHYNENRANRIHPIEFVFHYGPEGK